MELNKTLLQIQKLLDERNWSLYKLSKESEIPYSSLSSLFQKNNQPTLSTLEKICNGFHITMEEFFSDTPPFREDIDNFSTNERYLLKSYRTLSKQNKRLLLYLIELMNKD